MPVQSRDDEQLDVVDAPMLLAIMVAARRIGDRRLERIARRELETRHHIKVRMGLTAEEVPCPR
jgi:hypothetical protein